MAIVFHLVVTFKMAAEFQNGGFPSKWRPFWKWRLFSKWRQLFPKWLPYIKIAVVFGQKINFFHVKGTKMVKYLSEFPPFSKWQPISKWRRFPLKPTKFEKSHRFQRSFKLSWTLIMVKKYIGTQRLDVLVLI